MFKFLHKLFNPHCPECRSELVCKSCETLRIQLDLANHEREQMLDTLINIARPEIIRAEPKVLEPLLPKVLPWHQKKRILEEEDRVAARLKREFENNQKRSKELDKESQTTNPLEVKIEAVEKELGLMDA